MHISMRLSHRWWSAVCKRWIRRSEPRPEAPNPPSSHCSSEHTHTHYTLNTAASHNYTHVQSASNTSHLKYSSRRTIQFDRCVKMFKQNRWVRFKYVKRLDFTRHLGYIYRYSGNCCRQNARNLEFCIKCWSWEFIAMTDRNLLGFTVTHVQWIFCRTN